MRPYSQDLRERVLGALERGDSPTRIAARYEVSRVWVYQVSNRLKREGKRTSATIGGHRRSLLAPFEAEVRSWIAEQPDMTLGQMCERLAADYGVILKAPALWHQLDKWGLSYKKNSARQRARAARGATSSAGLEAKPNFARHHKARVS
jgi:transposase